MVGAYNINLLEKLNLVRGGQDQTFTIGYIISNNASKLIKNGGILNPVLTDTQFKNDVQSAVMFWVNTLNNVYKSNKKVKAGLKCRFVNSNSSDNDLNINISSKKITTPVSVSGSNIVLNSNLAWKSLSYESGLDVFSHVIYGIGKILGLQDSHFTDSVMNKSHLKVNYISYYSLNYENSGIIKYPDSILDADTLKNLKIKYGSMLYTYAIVYGCTDSTAENYNKNATRSDGSCKYVKRKLPSSYKSNINKY
jgi:hypothetical protein